MHKTKIGELMERLLTPFGEKLDKKLPLNDYPRPQMQRDSFLNLNGIWDYAIYPIGETFMGYQGDIVVPFSPESILSGVERMVTPSDKLYYRRNFIFVKESHRALLHFGAVDYECVVKINNKLAGEHKGGYFPFCFDITDLVVEGNNEITVEVVDPSDTGTQARGKQSSKRGGIWYTPQSGIWQTVWIEQVADNYISYIKMTPDIDKDYLAVEVDFFKHNEKVLIEVFDGELKIASVVAEDGKVIVPLKEYQCWSPEQPKLYDIVFKTESDMVYSYFGMRKFGIGKDTNNIARLMLNNKPYFHNGLLDQGYWSDGMYTPCSDEAMIYDIELMKEMGFNMLRKHIKIEPLRWYYHCDRLGMLVWQDMINGGGLYKFSTIGALPFMGIMLKDDKYKTFSREDVKGREEFYVDSERMIKTLYNTVSLAMWVPFNEGWGQFDAEKAYNFYKKLDSTRTIDHASGWHDQKGGDFRSLHVYFRKIKMPKDKRPIILSEFGGYSLQAKNHMYNKDKFFGYRKYYDQPTFEKALKELYKSGVIDLIKKGLSATVYTEVSDVEDECNGLVSYDRKVVKVNMDVIKKINEQIKL